VSEQKIDEKRLAEIETRAQEATPGPWRCEEDNFNFVTTNSGRYTIATPGTFCPLRTMHFIAAARTDVPDLIADLRLERSRIEAALALCRAELERNKSMHSTATDGFAFQVALALTGGKL